MSLIRCFKTLALPQHIRRLELEWAASCKVQQRATKKTLQLMRVAKQAQHGAWDIERPRKHNMVRKSDIP